jgi:hypothetical protein
MPKTQGEAKQNTDTKDKHKWPEFNTSHPACLPEEGFQAALLDDTCSGFCSERWDKHCDGKYNNKATGFSAQWKALINSSFINSK